MLYKITCTIFKNWCVAQPCFNHSNAQCYTLYVNVIIHEDVTWEELFCTMYTYLRFRMIKHTDAINIISNLLSVGIFHSKYVLNVSTFTNTVLWYVWILLLWNTKHGYNFEHVSYSTKILLYNWQFLIYNTCLYVI